MKILENITASDAALTAIACFHVIVIATSYTQETTSTTPYGKFAAILDGSKTKTIDSRSGMLVIYVPPFLTAIAVIIGIRSTLACLFCFLHFAKRVLEVLFVHKYSGTMDRSSAVSIGTFYALTALLVCLVSSAEPSEVSKTLGTAAFAIGSTGNGYHHYLLSKLRSESNSKEYVAPHGGLFDYAAAPHYMFEIVAWLGIAVASQHLNAYLVMMGMVSYLSGRAVSQNRWNCEKFSKEDWPRSRKNLVPFVF